MPRNKLTSRLVDSIKPPASGRAEYWDESVAGFGLRVSDAGRKTWVLMYRHDGRQRRLSIGTYPALPLAGARDKAKEALSEVAKGRDPAGEKQARRKAETFGDLAAEYIEVYAKKRKRTWKRDQQALDRDILPELRHRKAADVTRRDVNKILDAIVNRGAPILANRTLEILRRIYNWGISREIVAVNPCHRLEPPGAEKSRERVLDDDEIKALWTSLDAEPFHWQAQFKLRLLTAQRGGEVARLRRSDLDSDRRWWTIPPEFSKNGLPHRVPLSDPARAIVLELEAKAVERAKGKSGEVADAETDAEAGEVPDWLFASFVNDGPMLNPQKPTQRLRKLSKVDFVPHDLRRTASSKMTGDLGVTRFTIGRILNHADKSVTATYDRYAYDKEKRQALDAWAKRLDEIVSGKEQATNVVQLAANR